MGNLSAIWSLGTHTAVLTVLWFTVGEELLSTAGTGRETTVTVSMNIRESSEEAPVSFDPPAIPLQYLEPQPQPVEEIPFEVRQPPPAIAAEIDRPAIAAPAFESPREKPFTDAGAFALPLTVDPAAAGGNPSQKGEPREIFTPHPTYPAVARRMGYEGRVVVGFEINADGACSNAAVTHSSGYEALDTAAINAVTSWRFEPATENGNPVVSRREIAFNFQLKGGE